MIHSSSASSLLCGPLSFTKTGHVIQYFKTIGNLPLLWARFLIIKDFTILSSSSFSDVVVVLNDRKYLLRFSISQTFVYKFKFFSQKFKIN